jgi:hypothetical protein
MRCARRRHEAYGIRNSREKVQEGGGYAAGSFKFVGL